MNKKHCLWVCDEITRDVERDISESEGQPFTGKNVHELFGKQGAAIVALANLVKVIIEEKE